MSEEPLKIPHFLLNQENIARERRAGDLCECGKGKLIELTDGNFACTHTLDRYRVATGRWYRTDPRQGHGEETGL